MDISEQNARIDALNEHPIDVAALEAMRRANKYGCSGVGALRQLHVLSLASIALPADDREQGAEQWAQFELWTRNAERMERALRELEEAAVTPENLLHTEILDAAKMILDELGVIRH